MNPTTVCSFWVHRPTDFPDAADYVGMLKMLDVSCRLAGMRHVVLTDAPSSTMLPERMEFFTAAVPQNLLQATTAAQAEWVRTARYPDDDTVFVGADCLVLRDFRPFLRPAELSICTFPHPTLWIMNGFIHVPAASRDKVLPLFDEVAKGTRPLPANTCDDMRSWERALRPRPKELWGKQERRGLTVRFLAAFPRKAPEADDLRLGRAAPAGIRRMPEPLWNERPLSADEPYADVHVKQPAVCLSVA